MCVPESCRLGATIIGGVKQFSVTLLLLGGFWVFFRDEDKNSESLIPAHSRPFCFVALLLYIESSKSLHCL